MQQALVRALEKSYLSEVGKLQREIQQLSSKRQGISERPATASGIFPHRSTATVGVANTCSPALRGSPSPSVRGLRSTFAPGSPVDEQRASSAQRRSEDSWSEATGLKQTGGDKEGVRHRERQALLSDSERKARARTMSAGGGGLYSGVSRLYQRPSTATELSQLAPNRGGHGLDVRPSTADRPSVRSGNT